MSHYVNKYGNDWDDFVDYALMVHRSTPHTVTKYSPYYLLHGRDMRMPSENDLTARIETSDNKSDSPDKVARHIDELADNLREAFEIVRESNKVSRAKQKAYYDRNTKLVSYSEGDYVYLKEMVVGVEKSKKFRSRWRGPYLRVNRFSVLNYQIQIVPGKYMTVNVNRLKRCHNPPGKGTSKNIVPSPKTKLTDDDWSDTDDEPLSNLCRSKYIPSSQRGPRVSETEGPGEAVTIDDTIQDGNDGNDSVIQYRPEDRPEEVELETVTDVLSETPETIINERDAVQGNSDETEPNQPYPYDLRPLPGRRNYHPTEH
jgi:hypothetical protein